MIIGNKHNSFNSYSRCGKLFLFSIGLCKAWCTVANSIITNLNANSFYFFVWVLIWKSNMDGWNRTQLFVGEVYNHIYEMILAQKPYRTVPHRKLILLWAKNYKETFCWICCKGGGRPRIARTPQIFEIVRRLYEEFFVEVFDFIHIRWLCLMNY